STKPLARLVQSVEQHAFAIFVIGVALRQKSAIVQHFFVECPSVLRESKRRIRTKKLREIDGVRHWVRDRQIRPRGIDVDGRNVHLYFGRSLFQIKAADAARAES